MNRISLSKADFWVILVSVILLSVFSFYLYYYQWALWIASDYTGHLNILEDFIAIDKTIFPPLYYYSVFYLNFIIKYKYDYIASSMLILGIAVLLKYIFYLYYFRTEVLNWKMVYYLVPIGFLLFAPLYLFQYDGVYFYLGKFSTAVWHNCTTTFSWPLVLVLFYFSLNWLKRPQNKTLLWVLILGIVTGLAKPSFLFAFIPAFPLIAFYNNRDPRSLFLSSLVSAVFIGLIFYIKYQVYSENPQDNILYPKLEINEVIILPFAVFRLSSENAFLDLFSSFLFLGVAILGFRKELFSSLDFNFSLLLSLFGISIFLLFAESGYRFSDGNFYWQIPLTLSVLYLSIGKEVLNSLSKSGVLKLEKRHLLLGICWILHVVSGVLYLDRYFSMGTFL